MSAPPAIRRAGVALAAVLSALAATGCGGGERRDAGDKGGTYSIDVVRVQFPQRQHLADKPTFTMTVRNAGDETIPRVAVTLHGFSERADNTSEADPRGLVWLVDEGPQGTITAIEDTWTTAALHPGATTTLRWQVTPVVAGTHKLTYAVAGALAGTSRTRSANGGRTRGAITVRVDAKPARTRVDPSTGRVVRE